MKHPCFLCHVRCADARRWLDHLYYSHIAALARWGYTTRQPNFKGKCPCGGDWTGNSTLWYVQHCIDRLTVAQREALLPSPIPVRNNHDLQRQIVLLHLSESLVGDVNRDGQ